MKISILVIFSIAFFPFIKAEPEPAYSARIDNPHPHEFNIHINHAIMQDMSLNNNNKNNAAGTNCMCSELYGAALHECMNSLSSEDMKKNFLELNPRCVRNYLRTVGYSGTEDILACFSEEEWQDWHSKLPSEIQKCIGKTKEEASKKALAKMHDEVTALIRKEMKRWTI